MSLWTISQSNLTWKNTKKQQPASSPTHTFFLGSVLDGRKIVEGTTAATMAKVAGLSEELRALDAELRSLGGGGDAAIAPAAVYCSVCPAPVRSATVGGASRHTDGRRGDGEPRAGGRVAARRRRRRREGPERRYLAGPRRYRMTAASDSGDAPDELARDVCDWLMRGFDALVVTHGQSGTGKSHVTFGGGGMGVHPSPTGGFDKPGVITRLFRLVFTRAAREEAAWRLAEDAGMHAGAPNQSSTRFDTGSACRAGRCPRTAASWISSTRPATLGASRWRPARAG